MSFKEYLDLECWISNLYLDIWPIIIFLDTYFWIGRGYKPDASGFAIPDETGSTSPLKRYANRTIVLTLPTNVFDIDYFGIYSKSIGRSLAHVPITFSKMNVPPAFNNLGIQPEVSYLLKEMKFIKKTVSKCLFFKLESTIWIFFWSEIKMDALVLANVRSREEWNVKANVDL